MSLLEPLTITAIAAHLHVSRWTVSRLIESGDLPKDADLAVYVNWLHSRAITPGQEDVMPTDLPQLPNLHPFTEVATRLGLSLRGLRDGARARKFAHTRIGRERYFTDPQLEAFLAARAVVPERDTALDGVRERRDRRRHRSRAAA